MTKNPSRRDFSAAALATIAASTLPAPYVWAAEKKYDAGASDTEIKIGQTVPHSGPGSLYGVLGRIGEAYFQMLNEKGGINGRKVKFLTMDDAYSAPKCVEATRRLVEQEEVLALYGSLGTAPQTAVHKYLNSKGVPQLLLNTGASKWNNPKEFKWTMAGLPLYPTEARILARHVVSVKPNAKVGILYQNDDFGRDFLGPFKKVLEDAGGTAKVIMEQTYDLTDPTVDSQLINLSKSGADVFYNISTGKASSQSIRKVAELGWKPLQLLSAGSTGRSILNAAGLENAAGIVAIRYNKEVGLPKWEKDPDVMAYRSTSPGRCRRGRCWGSRPTRWVRTGCGPTKLPVVLWVLAATAIAQVAGWLAEGVRRGPHGILLFRALVALLALAAGLLVVSGHLAGILDHSPTRGILSSVLAVQDGRWGFWLLGLLVLTTLGVAAAVLGALPARWALRRPMREEQRLESGRYPARPTAASDFMMMLRIDRAGVWRSVPLRRGIMVLALMPGAVAVAGNLEWQMLTVLPGLVASGAALLFGVNTWCLDGRGALWRESLPVAPGVADHSRRGPVRGAAVLRAGDARPGRPACRAAHRTRGHGTRLLHARGLRAGGGSEHALEHRAPLLRGPAQCPGHACSTGGDGRLQRPSRAGHHGDRAGLLGPRRARLESVRGDGGTGLAGVVRLAARAERAPLGRPGDALGGCRACIRWLRCT